MQNIGTLFFFFIIATFVLEFLKPKKSYKRKYKKTTEKKSNKEKLVFWGLIFAVFLGVFIVNTIVKLIKYVSNNIAELSILIGIFVFVIYLIHLLIKIFFPDFYTSIKQIFKNIFDKNVISKNYNFEETIENYNKNEEERKLYRDNFNKKQDLQDTYPNNSYSYISKSKIKKSNYQKGVEYEEQIGEYYESLGYYVNYHGKDKGKKDKGIDLIASKENETLLIQCKNWENSKVKQKDLKEFFGNCSLYLENNDIKTLHIRKLFVTSDQSSDYGVTKFMQENYKSMEYKIIPYNK